MSGIAVIGMACRFPGARTVAEYWRNLRDGVESIARLADEDLRGAGVPPEMRRQPAYVRAAGVLEDVEQFDAAFFGFSPREAEILDVQHRLFLECAWEALEDACCEPDTFPGSIGVYAGAGMNAYLLANLLPEGHALAAAGGYQALLSNDKDFLPTRVSYKLNLRGPSVSVQTACSTSLVAIHVASQALLAGECDVALAGGVSVRVPQKAGYLHEEGMILSPDGHCRAFDADARGTVPGSGAGVVVLKRLDDALAAGDRIDAVILGSAINNDGARKVGYTAPSVDGQRAVIREAMAVAGVTPDTIGLVEAHGTGTSLGDPIEFTALCQAFEHVSARGACALGAVKTNLGHLDAAAGVAGFIKAVLALRHREIPPTLHFTTPNPQIDLASSPFHINTRLEPWPRRDMPARAGVSSFGIGGTNAHVVLEAAPPTAARPAAAGSHAIVLSARTERGLDAHVRAVAGRLAGDPSLDLADVAWSLQTGRRAFEHRLALVASSADAAARALSRGEGDRGIARPRPVVFMFPGQGSQFPGMAAGLYESAPVFRETFDACCRLAAPPLRELLLTIDGDPAAATRLTSTGLAQPALFIVEYALATQLLALGVEPAAMIGHSIGEYVAACLGGTMQGEDALALVSERGRLMETLPPGRMLAVRLSSEACAGLVDERVSIAAINAPALTVVSGPIDAIESLASRCAARDIECHELQTSHAFHSAAMDPILAAFGEAVAGVRLSPPARPWISNLTGKAITSAEATDPQYWVRHLRQPVRFSDGLAAACRSHALLLEVGPGRALGTLAREQDTGAAVVSCMRHARERHDAGNSFARALGRLWAAGVAIRWDRLGGERPRRRVSLPTSPFERQRYWIDAPSTEATAAARADAVRPIDDWFYVPVWKSAPAPEPRPDRNAGSWLVVAQDDDFVARDLAARLEADGNHVVVRQDGADIRGVRDVVFSSTGEGAEGFFRLLRLAQGLADSGADRIRLNVLSSPPDAALLGPVLVLPREVPSITVRSIDYPAPRLPRTQSRGQGAPYTARLVELLHREVASSAEDVMVSFRENQRFVRGLAPVRLPSAGVGWRTGAHYLITGGLSGVGLVIASHLARSRGARLTLVGRTPRIGAIEAIESAGGAAWAAQADVADLAQLQDVVREATARFGPIHGVVHAAGVAGGGLISLKTRDDVERIWRPKIDGARNLVRLFEGRGLDFLVFMSSLSGILGETGQVEYCAAGAVLDAMAHELRARGERAVSIDWDTWREVGMAVSTPLPAALQALRDERLAHGIANADGADAFSRALAADLAQVVISTRDPAVRARNDARDAAQLASAAEAPVSLHARPELAVPYEPPATPPQQALCRIWQSLLGIEPIGIHDDFFDLGGHSLLATQVLARLRGQMDVHLTLTTFFERPTIAALAAVIEQLQLDAILADVGDLSDEEVARQLGGQPS